MPKEYVEMRGLQRLRRICGLASMGVFLVVVGVAISSASTAMAENITYKGDGSTLRVDPQNPANPPDSVVPMTGIMYSASGNTITINYESDGINVDPDWVYGGFNSILSSTGNTVNMTKGLVVHGIYGGYTKGINQSAEKNTVKMSGGTVGSGAADDLVIGGYSDNGDAVKNLVDISAWEIDCKIYGDVYGGLSDGNSKEAKNNTVNISGRSSRGNNIFSNIYGNVYGGFSDGNATDNSVSIGDYASVSGSVYGGKSDNGNATLNNVDISGGYVGNVYGGHAVGNDKIAENNTINIYGDADAGNIYGGYSDGNATDNKIYISGKASVGDVTGGYSLNGNAADNEVFINSGYKGSLGIVWGSVGNVYGGYSDGDATDNNVFIGIYTSAENVTGGHSLSGDATGNEVLIFGKASNVYGGYSDNGNATNNTVTLFSEHLGTIGHIYGGHGTKYPDVADYFTDNTLYLLKYHYTAFDVKNFENFYFSTQISPTNPKEPVLTVTGTASLGRFDGGNEKSTIKEVNTIGAYAMQEGEKLTLIKANEIELNGFDQEEAVGRHGVTLDYRWKLAIINNTWTDELVANLQEVNALPEAKVLTEGYVAGQALLNHTTDLITGHSMSEAIRNAWWGEPRGWGIFADVAGGRSKYNTGSHVNMSNFSFITGIAKGTVTEFGEVTVAAFFEFGTGHYDTFNSFSNAHNLFESGNFRGEGDTSHYGSGVFSRIDFGYDEYSFFYTEGSFRMGSLRNSFRSNDLVDPIETAASYATASTYYSLHLGVGKIWCLTESTSFDLYAKYLWTRLNGTSVTLSTEESVDFQNMNSHRLRLGGRLVFAGPCPLSPYLGAAWEHEFSGDANASAYGYAFDAASLRGSTCVTELGFSWKPDNGKFFVDLGAQGHFGKRLGVTGNLWAGWCF